MEVKEYFKDKKECNFNDSNLFNKGVLPAKLYNKAGDKWGYVDKPGKFKIKPQFDRVESFTNNGLAAVKTDVFEIEANLDNVFTFYDDGYGIFRIDYEKGVIDKNGKHIIDPIFYDLGR